MDSRLSKLITRFLRVFFQLLYHEFAWSYNLVARVVSLGLWNEWIATSLQYCDSSPVLELGFGRGFLQALLLNQGMQVFGLDESRQMIRLADKRLSHLGLKPNLINGIARNLPFQNQTFSIIISTFPSEYIVDIQTLNEIQRVLRMNGKLIILPAAWITGSTLPHRLAAWLFRITHEAPPIERVESTWVKLLEERLSGLHFEVHSEVISARDSQLLIIIGVRFD